jgi:sugar phosphate isomerase/epimerase
MAMKLALAPLTLFRPPPLEVVTAAGEAGYDAVGFQLGLQEVPVSPLASDPTFLKAALSELDRFGLSVLEVSNIVLEPGRTIDEGRLLIDFAAAVGAFTVQATVWDHERGRVVDRLGVLCGHAAAAGLTITVEFMPYSAVRNLGDARDLVRSTDAENARVLLDTLHFVRSGGTIDDLDDEAVQSFQFVQLCDAVAKAPDFDHLREEAIGRRLPLGEGALPLDAIMDRLPTDLPLSIEAPCQRLAGLANVAQATEHLEIARRFLAPWADRWQA